MLHGQGRVADTLIATPADGFSMLPVSSYPRLLMVTVPLPDTTQLNDQLVAPVAGRQVAPLSTDTSTPDTIPPPESVAVPVIVTADPAVKFAPLAGDVIVDVGASASAETEAPISPACSVVGCTPMSAKRFTVACFMRRSTAVPARSCVASRPHAHWTVPAPKTSAPLGCRYNVRLCVTEPAPNVD